MAFLRYSSGPHEGQIVELNLQNTTIGRDPHCDVRLDDTNVSKEHARVWAELKWYVEDLNSLNLTLLNGAEVDPNVPTQIESGDRLTFGTTDVRFDGVLHLASSLDKQALAALDAAEGMINKLGEEAKLLRQAILERDIAIAQRDQAIKGLHEKLAAAEGLVSKDSLDDELRRLREEIMAAAQKRIDAFARETREMERRYVTANTKIEHLEKQLKDKDDEMNALREGRNRAAGR